MAKSSSRLFATSSGEYSRRFLGGWTAAPVTSRVIARAAPLLGVMPVDEESGDVLKAMLISSRKGRSGAAF